MKWVVYIFSFYVLVLSGIPCNADDGCCTDEISATTTSNRESGNADHKPACPCSPFFACSACHGVVIPDNRIEFFKALPPVAKLHFFYSKQSLSDFPAAIWQPPKTIWYTS
ncbi:DUF6660 family protein [Chitinophaga niastensis]|uniref:DUF6660 family protein n=1 Tax=Chitinophaga niastensis TaxID=536980 RepID=UPI003CCB96AE